MLLKLFALAFGLIFVFAVLPFSARAQSVGGPTRCPGTVIDIGVPKKLLPFREEARPGHCGTMPKLIVMHTTWGNEQGANDLWNYFATQTRGASTQFVVGRDGSMLQMLETLADKAEVGWAVGSQHNSDSVSIELNNPGNYSSKSQVPPAQYASALRMVKSLMQAYNIPLSGVVSHGSLGGGAGDPGEGFLRDFKADLPGATALDGSAIGTGTGTGTSTGTGGSASDVSCVITRVGDPSEPKPPLPPECISSTSNLNIPPGLDAACEATGADASVLPSNVILEGYDGEYAQYIYDIFGCLSQTKFGSLIGSRTTVINAPGPSGTYQMSCSGDSCTVWMRGNLPESNFKHILTHEFGHVISATNTREALLKNDFANAFSSEGGLSPYSGGGNGCAGNGLEEDFAENVAYFYNPQSGIATGACDNRSSIPNPLYDTTDFPLHLGVAKKTLL